MQWHRLSRRSVLRGAAALGVAAAARPRAGRAQGAGVLRVRSYSDLQVLDPAHR
jgi:peptide/nickel transport system substrate-binding protein